MSDASRQSLTVVPAGTMEYRRCLELQETLHARVVAGGESHYAIVVEHPAVLTFGKHADKGYLLFAAEHFKKLGVDLVDTDRGGEVTAHMPGQLVVYPILRLADFNLTPRRYVALLEEAVICVLASFGITAAVDPEHPGVWVGHEKICALGVRIKERVSLHGLALNVSNDLSLFDQIVPCGIRGRGVTSVSRLLGKSVPVDAVTPLLIKALSEGLAVAPAATRMAAGLQWEDGVIRI